MKTIDQTQYQFPNQTDIYRGKVREMYRIGTEYIVSIASDRISAFDVVLPQGIPYKGQVLNQIAAHFLEKCKDIVPNWFIESPHPHVSVGHQCEPLKVEMVIRGYLTGHAWREYQAGKREICGVALPDGLIENQKLPRPIITPTTKAEVGNHDQDISREAILAQGIVSEEAYLTLEKATYALFERGTQMATERGLILVDTKYEFGKSSRGEIMLIDEIHTPDSSRYFLTEDYHPKFERGAKPNQLSKEFVREWLMENGFQGKEGQVIPELNQPKIKEISDRYIQLFELLTGSKFEAVNYDNIQSDISNLVSKSLTQLT